MTALFAVKAYSSKGAQHFWEMYRLRLQNRRESQWKEATNWVFRQAKIIENKREEIEFDGNNCQYDIYEFQLILFA